MAKPASSSDIHTDSLTAIPDDFCVKYLPNGTKLSEKVLQKGLNYFTQGYIHDIKIFSLDDAVQVAARCWRSMRKNQSPHQLRLEIKNSLISESYCSCKVGLNGHCSHVIGLIKSLQGFKLHNFSNVPEQQSCTSIPQQWHVPRGSKIKPVPISHVVVARPTESRKRKPVTCQIDINQDLPEVSKEDQMQLNLLKGTPLEYTISSDHPFTNTPLGDVQIGSILSYQTKNIKEIVPANSDGCGNTDVFHRTPIPLPPQFTDLYQEYTNCDPTEIEINTREQSESAQWYNERQKRLTASNFGKVLQRKSTPNDKFLSSLFTLKKITAPSLDYGKFHEKDAKAKYLQEYPSRHIHTCGFVVNKEFAFLGATPDGKVCDNGQCGLLEIKCPYSARNMTITEACNNIKDFFLSKDNDLIALKNTHAHYAQVQGQLLITGCTFCDFVVFTQKDMFVQRIQPDLPFMTMMLEKLCMFFKTHAKPFLVNQNVHNEMSAKS